MSGDLVSVRVLAAGASVPQGELLRKGAAAIPELLSHVHVATAAQARTALGDGHVDVALIDAAMAEREEVLAAAHSAPNRPPIVLLAPTAQEAAYLAVAAVADAVAVKPAKLVDARALIESCVRLKVPSRVLVVDDSSAMRNLVRKIQLLGVVMMTSMPDAALAERARGAGALGFLKKPF